MHWEKYRHGKPVALAGLNSALALVFQLTVIYRLGVGDQSDLFYAVAIVVGFLYTMVFDAVNNVLIPMFVERIREREDAPFFWNTILVVLGLGLLILLSSYVPILFAFPILFKNLSEASAPQIGSLLIGYSLYLTLFCAVGAKSCYLYARGRATVAQLGIFFGWVVTHGAIWNVQPTQDFSQIAYCLVAGNAVALLFPNLDRSVLAYRWGRFRNDSKELLARALPMTSSSAILLLEPLVDGAIAARLGPGSLTVYHLFARGFVQINAVAHSGYIQPAVKRLAELVAVQQWAKLRQRIRSVAVRSSLLNLALLAPLAPILVFLQVRRAPALEPYVSILENNFPVLLLLLGLLCGPVFCKTYANGLFVLRRHVLFVGLTIAAFSLGLALKFLGAAIGSLPGLALGTSLYWAFYAGVVAFSFQRAVRKRAVVDESDPRGAVRDAISPLELAD